MVQLWWKQEKNVSNKSCIVSWGTYSAAIDLLLLRFFYRQTMVTINLLNWMPDVSPRIRQKHQILLRNTYEIVSKINNHRDIYKLCDRFKKYPLSSRSLQYSHRNRRIIIVKNCSLIPFIVRRIVCCNISNCRPLNETRRISSFSASLPLVARKNRTNLLSISG